MAISRDEVAYFARLSGLDLGKEELDQLTPQLDEILTTLAHVQDVPPEGIRPTSDAWELTDGYRGGVAEEPPLDTPQTPDQTSAAPLAVGSPADRSGGLIVG